MLAETIQPERLRDTTMKIADLRPTLSVIIAFRGRDLARLHASVTHHLASTICDDIEILVSGYGPHDPEQVRAVARELGCVYVPPQSGAWSRSCAVNAGIGASCGDHILVTDADILVTPQTHDIALRALKQRPASLQVKQINDLPEGIGVADLDTLSWDELHDQAQTRPRWGTGGLAAFHRDTADRLRGYDERLTDTADADFRDRVRAAGGIVNWIADDAAQVFHLWHPGAVRTRPGAPGDPQHGRSIIRNLHPGAIYRGRGPLVSVVLVTQTHSDAVKRAIKSVLQQSFGEFELIVVTTSSTNPTPEFATEINDPRVHYIAVDPHTSIWAARNQANATAVGQYIAVLEDGDLMFPDRLEIQLRCFEAMVQGVYGGWIACGEKTEHLNYHPGKAPLTADTLCSTRDVVRHGTILVENWLCRQTPYAEGAGSSPADSAVFRMARHGARLVHCGAYVSVSENVPEKPQTAQKTWAAPTRNQPETASCPSEQELALLASDQMAEDVQIAIKRCDIDVVKRLLDHKTYVHIFQTDPKPANQYTPDIDHALIGQVEEGQMQILKEVSLLETKPSSQLAGALFSAKELQFVSTDAPDVLPPYATAASVIATAETCILCKSEHGGALDVVSSQICHLLPEREAIAIFSSGGHWSFAFDQGSELRKRVIERKSGILSDGSSISTLSKVNA